MKDTITPARPHIVTQALTHALFILILFALPEIVMSITMPHHHAWGIYPGFYLKIALILTIFYINYYWLVDKMLGHQKPRILSFVLLNIALVFAMVGLIYVIQIFMDVMPHGRRWEQLSEWQKMLRVASMLLRDAVVMVLVVGLATAMRMSARWQDLQRQQRELLAAQKSTELDNLKSQLNPHFLFNTLNTIYALVDIDRELAKQAIYELSGLLRYVLYENKDLVNLELETGFIQNYAALMRLRIKESLHPVKVDIDIDHNTGVRIPPLLLVPLVENAFKYGIDCQENKPIEISVKLKDGILECVTSNGFDHTSKAESEQSGIGLANLRRRLSLIYGSRASLRTKVFDNVYSTRLTIPVEKS